ncbi:MAG: cytochrome c [Burkholderiaceae bacterium]
MIRRLAAQLRLATLRIGLAVCAGAVALPSPASEAAAPSEDAATLDLGRQVYNLRCYFCHGYSGDAKTLAASVLRPAPRDFTSGGALPRQAVADAVARGRPGTAMPPFRAVLNDAEIDAVAAFVVDEFVRRRARNTAYHTAANGWPAHERYATAFPFASGALAIDAPEHSFSADEQRGRTLYLNACVTCHDRGRVANDGPAWSWRPLSYPRADSGADAQAFESPGDAAAQPRAPRLPRLSARERLGQRLFQHNCAFCHGANGTGKNWIGQFLEPKARDLTQFSLQDLPAQRLRRTIRDGLSGTSMPAWRDVLKPAEIDAVSAYVTRAFIRLDAR